MSRIETVSVVGGGWSLGNLSAKDRARIPGLKICVNDAAMELQADMIVSMDRLWAENRILKLCAMARPTWLRASTMKNLGDTLACFHDISWLHAFDNDHQSAVMSDDPARLNGTNSGLCALNLAYQQHPKRIILWGFDMGRSPAGAAYWYPPYPWAKPGGGTGAGRYAEWAAQFAPAAKACASAGIEVVNASPVSAIPVFAKADPRSLLT